MNFIMTKGVFLNVAVPGPSWRGDGPEKTKGGQFFLSYTEKKMQVKSLF